MHSPAPASIAEPPGQKAEAAGLPRYGRYGTPAASSAPFLHLHGLHDEEVPVSQARRMHAALRAAGVPSELALLDGGHYVNDTHRAEVEAQLLAFFRRVLDH